jgi:hypothetical protein
LSIEIIIRYTALVSIQKTVQQQIPAVKPARRRKFKPLLIFGLVSITALLAAAVFLLYAVVIPAQRVLASAEIIKSNLQELATGFANSDISKLESTVKNVEAELNKINTELERYEFLNNYEFSRGYYKNMQVVRKLSMQSMELLDKSYPELEKVFKGLGYKTQTTAASAQPVPANNNATAEAEKDLSGIVQQLPQIVALYEKYEPEIIEIVATMQELDPAYIPSVGGLGKYSRSLAKVQTLTQDFPTLSNKVRQILRVTPTLLGANKPVTYLVIFQNEKELRASSGILSAYGHITIDKGKVVGEINAVDMWDLHDYLFYTIRRYPRINNIYGQSVLMNRGCGATIARPQDVGMYPDLKWTVDSFLQYYNIANRYNPGKYKGYDHALIINTYFASDLVSLIDPIQDPETKRVITADNLAKEIFSETSAQPGNKPLLRKKFIGAIASIAEDKFKELPSEQLLDVVTTMFNTIIEKNIAFVSKDPGVQNFFEEFKLSGRFEQNFNGDYFHLNEAQNCSLKANFYIKDTVTQNITIEGDNSIRKDVNIQWRNDHVYNAAERYVLSNEYAFLYRAWVRVVAPKDTKFLSTDGFAKSWTVRYRPVSYFDKVFQKQVSDNIIRFDHRRANANVPIKYHELNVAYKLPGNLNYNPTQGYKMLIQRHPGKKDEKYKINIKHQGQTTSTEFVLNRDKIVSFKDGVIAVTDYPHPLDEYIQLVGQVKDLMAD